MAVKSMSFFQIQGDQDNYKIFDMDSIHSVRVNGTAIEKNNNEVNLIFDLDTIGAAGKEHNHIEYFLKNNIIYSSTTPNGGSVGQIWLKPVG